MGSPFEGSPRAGVAEYVKGGMLYKEWAVSTKIGKSTNQQINKSTNRQIDKSTNRQIISQTQSYSLPKTSPKTHTHQR